MVYILFFIYNFFFYKGLTSLESLFLGQNRIEKLDNMDDLKKLINIDLSYNVLQPSINLYL